MDFSVGLGIEDLWDVCREEVLDVVGEGDGGGVVGLDFVGQPENALED